MTQQISLEVHIKSDSRIVKELLSSNIKTELDGKNVKNGDMITSFTSKELSSQINSIRCEFESGNKTKEKKIDKDSVSIFTYALNSELPYTETLDDDDESTLAASFTTLPSALYEGLWETLIYDFEIKENLLQYAQAIMFYSSAGVDPALVSCSRVLLIHGPPGTGKTSLCKALAQKLSIRLGEFYSDSMLIEINTHSLFSKYFSESGKLVAKMFNKIREMAEQSNNLICVLVDEVESLTLARSAATSGTEPSDALRVVNAVLTNLDLLKNYPNILVFTTSNLTKAIDVAFVDRADLRVFISNPSPFAIYNIYYTVLNELIKKKIILGPCPEQIEYEEFKNVHSTVETAELIKLSRESEGLSGRALRKIPLRVHTSYIPPKKVVSLLDFIKAMSKAVKVFKEETETFSQDHTNLKC